MTGAPLTAAALLAAVVATIAIGAYGVRLSRTTSDFLVASRSVGPQWNAAAISGEYLSAASFLGVAGLIAKYGADALWYPVGFTAGYLGVLLFVAAPLRRSGAYTVPDFAEFRLGSVRLRKVAMLVVVVICLFYLAPQYQGAGLALKTLLGVPVWIGPLLVAAIVITNVVAGTPGTGSEWIASGGGLGGGHPLYQVLSIIVATFLGTMGLPHVLVRFYTNPDGRAARRTALAVVALLSVFYFFPILLGVFSRLYVPQLLITGTADAAVLLAPGAAVGGIGGQLLAALVAAGAIAAFLATSSGLLISVAGALATDVLRGRVRDFRIAAVFGGLIPIPLSLMVSGLELSRSVGLAFAVAASTLCPLLVLGIWWRGLTAIGAACGLAVGGCVCGSAALVAISGGIDDDVLGGWPAVMVGYPAAVSVPIAFLTMIVVSMFTRPIAGVAQIFARMHVPERLGLGVERVPAG